MSTEIATHAPTIGPVVIPPEEAPMVRQERWEDIRRLWTERVPIAEIARRLDLDRKTVRRCLRARGWQPYRRAPRPDTMLTPHMAYLTARASQVAYSAQILFQELRLHRGYRGSYDTVKLFVRPLRAAALHAERTQRRFETPPGQQSQIDWGTATVSFRARSRVVHVFVLTLGFSRRSFYRCYPNETLPQFLDAHEQAFAYFGGHTREHLYDRPRTVCQGTRDGHVLWNTSFRAFADYWSFEPRVCQPYRARTQGKVESGVKYFKHNFLPGRVFTDDTHLEDALLEWMSTIADVRLHGTTHERPIDRFVQEQPALVPIGSQPSFRLEAPLHRIVAEDWLVSVDTNRYSVPFTLIGQPIEVSRRGGVLRFLHRGTLVSEHAELSGRHQLRILPEHGPGAVARTTRSRRSTGPAPHALGLAPSVEVRDLAWYEALSGDTEIAAPSAERPLRPTAGLDLAPLEVPA